jgi:hypothetical protein
MARVCSHLLIEPGDLPEIVLFPGITTRVGRLLTGRSMGRSPRGSRRPSW